MFSVISRWPLGGASLLPYGEEECGEECDEEECDEEECDEEECGEE